MVSPPSWPEEHSEPLPTAPSRRPWRLKFADAGRGLKYGIRGQSSFFVHFFFAALVLVAGVILECELVHWCLLILCIGMVLAAELFNSAIESLFRELDESTQNRAWRALDIAAGAVLMVSIAAAIVGVLVLGSRLLVLLP